MKTITLNDQAYAKLCAWKESRKDSFSMVVNRVVPERGSLKSVMAAWKKLPELSGEQFDTLEKGLSDLNVSTCQKDPWTT